MRRRHNDRNQWFSKYERNYMTMLTRNNFFYITLVAQVTFLLKVLHSLRWSLLEIMTERFLAEFKVISDHSFLFIVRSDPNKRSQHKLFQILCVIFYTFVTSIVFYTAFQKEEGLVIQVVNGIFILMTLVLAGLIYELINNKEAIDELLRWCSERGHDKFDKFLQPSAGNRFNFSRNICTRIVWINYRCFLGLGLSLTLLVGVVMQYFPSLRYSLPIPWHMPVANWRTKEIFLLTFVIQLVSVCIMSQTVSFFVSLFMVYFIQVYVFLKITIDGIYQFNQQLQNADKRNDIDIDASITIFIKMILSVIR